MCSTCFGKNMSRRKAEVPSLADALAKGFSELKTAEENPLPSEEVSVIPDVQESIEVESSQKPQYGRPTQHKGQESSFVFTPDTPSESVNTDAEVTKKAERPVVEILDKPSTSLGDDFDVEW
tara:strand:- start:115 stop:480 length:366 start_codon:yes stop_codon:yes gene_type:complete